MTKHDIYVPIESPGDLRILHALLKEAGEPVNATDAYAMDNFGKYKTGVDINILNIQNLIFWNGRWVLTSTKREKKITLDELRSLLLPDSKYVGKWLKDPVGPNLMYITSEESNECLYGYGLNSEGVWSDYSTRGLGTCAFNFFAKRLAREATYLEVKDALIGQAKKRGFDKDYFSIKEAVHPTFTRECTPGGSFILTSDGKTLYYGGIALFHEGKWAELKEEVKFSEIKREMKTLNGEEEHLTEVLSRIRDILLPLVDSEDSPCGDMLGCTVNSVSCVECLVKQIAKQYNKLDK